MTPTPDELTGQTTKPPEALNHREALAVAGSCTGLYHVDRQPVAALQRTTRWPGLAYAPCAATAGPQSHDVQDTSTRPGPHGCPRWHAVE